MRPLVFEGALLVQAGEPESLRLALYETADGAFALAIEIPGCYFDAWRLDSLDEVAEFLGGFDPTQRLGRDITGVLEDAGEAEATARALDAQAAAIGPAFHRVVQSFLRVSPLS